MCTYTRASSASPAIMMFEPDFPFLSGKIQYGSWLQRGEDLAIECTDRIQVRRCIAGYRYTSASTTGSLQRQDDTKRCPFSLPATLRDVLSSEQLPQAFRKGALSRQHPFVHTTETHE